MFQSETRICQNCKVSFMIDASDFQFYERIKVPPPTFCPKCRSQRRLAFFNLMNLWKRKCDLCGKEKISMYPPEAPYKVYCSQCWWSDNWDPYDYGRNYDFSRPFFEQFKELWHEVPLLGLSIDLPTAEAAPYNNHCGHLKNCYLLFFADFNEDCAYGLFMVYNKNVFDSSLIGHSELCYDSMNCFKTNNCIGVSHVAESLDCIFSRDLWNCQNCFASASLRNKKYYIFNKPYSREDYFKEIKKWDLGSYKTYKEIKKLAGEHWKDFPPKPRWDDLSVNITGNYVYESKNCKECFAVRGVQDSKFIFWVTEGPVKDCYDITAWGNNMELCYECNVVGENVSYVKFCQEAGINLYNAEYCKLSIGGSNHFGCISIKKGDYCIFNKKYSEEEYKTLREKIIHHMEEMPYVDKQGRIYKYGEFFPIEVSPSAYNETIAQRLFPLTKEEAVKQGYDWRNIELRNYSITKLPQDLPDHIKDVPDSITNEVIQCAHTQLTTNNRQLITTCNEQCTTAFKIIPQELQFYRRMNLPLPRLCPNCRHYQRIKQRNPLKLWHRKCQCAGNQSENGVYQNITQHFHSEYPRPNEFQTTYAPDRQEIVYCEECYLAEVV